VLGASKLLLLLLSRLLQLLLCACFSCGEERRQMCGVGWRVVGDRCYSQQARCAEG